jgi:hypothetical protein
MRDGLKLARDAIARRVCVFNFLPSQQTVNEKFLCDLCDSSEAGGESMSKP